MSDPISRNGLVEFCLNTKDRTIDANDIMRFPSAEPEWKTGEWTLYESRSDIYDLEGVCTWGRAYRCSECGFIHWVIEDFGIYSFCPNCGARMEWE